MDLAQQEFKLIGLIGKMYSGKTTFANYICKERNFTKVSFADSLKELILNAELCTEKELEKKDKKTRFLLQHIGTDLIRKQIDHDFFIKKLEQKISQIKGNIIIDDIRFFNEYNYIQNKGGLIIKIIRPGLHNINNHVSETELDDIKTKIAIINGGNMKQFENKIINFMRTYL